MIGSPDFKWFGLAWFGGGGAWGWWGWGGGGKRGVSFDLLLHRLYGFTVFNTKKNKT